MTTFGRTPDKRQFGRRQTSLHAWITVPGRPRIPCFVRDLSVGGARLGFDIMPAALPYCFKLTIEATRFETACEIRHQRSASIGVEFVPMAALEAHSQRAAISPGDEWAGMNKSGMVHSAKHLATVPTR